MEEAKEPREPRAPRAPKEPREPKEPKESRPREKITVDTVIPPLPAKSERLPVPDEDRFQRDQKNIEGKIAKLREKKKGVHDQIKVKKEGGKMDNNDFSVKEFIGSKVTSRKELLNQRSKLRDELDSLKQEFYSMVDEQKKIRPKIKIFDKVKTEKVIDEIQRKIETTTITLAEEKKFISELSELQYSLPLIEVHATRAVKLDTNKARQEVIKAQILELNGQIDATSSLIEETTNKIKNSKDQVKSEIPGMLGEAKKIQEEIDALEQEKKKHYEEFREKKYAYQKQQSTIKQIEWMTKMKERIIEQEERRKKEEELAKQDEENKPHPYAKEILSCDTYISYLGRFVPKEGSTVPTEEKKIQGDGFLPDKASLNAKETEEWFGTGQKKPKKKKGKKQKKPEAFLTNLPIDLLNFFSYCGIKVPTNAEEAKDAVKVLQEKRQNWVGLDTRDEKEEEKGNRRGDDERTSTDLSFNPVNFPEPEESKEKEEYGIFKDSGPVLAVTTDARGKRGKRRFRPSNRVES